MGGTKKACGKFNHRKNFTVKMELIYNNKQTYTHIHITFVYVSFLLIDRMKYLNMEGE